MKRFISKKVTKKTNTFLSEAIVETEETVVPHTFTISLKKHFMALINKNQLYVGGTALVAATFIGNILNYIFNAYLGRVLTFNDFALIGLMGSFYSFSSIFFGIYNTTVAYRSSFLIGKYGDSAGYEFWKFTRKHAVYPSLVITILWLFALPLLMNFFHTTNIYLFVFFSLVLLLGFVSNINQGFLYSKMMFGSLAIINVLDPVVKLVTTFTLVYLGLKIWTFSAVPIEVFIVFLLGWFLIKKQIKPQSTNASLSEVHTYPKKFIIASLLSGLSTVGYFTFDIFLAKHFLSATQAGEYTLVSLVGRMIFFLGSITSPFIIPFISRYEGAKKNSTHALYILLAVTTVLVALGFILFGVFGYITVPILYGEKARVITPYVPYFTLGMAFYTISNVLVNYYLARKKYIFTVASSLLILLQIALIFLFHSSVKAISVDMAIVLGINLVLITALHLGLKQVEESKEYLKKVFGSTRVFSMKIAYNKK